ncbi:tetratricopeptide repeat protein [Deefgea tanakiae]|uniref:Tetratricopeptide repeat protein n=1 Tax=Deefgea tanakiae TaxID=2865840 RepID=A0ABX8Z3F2_9NEIS|nr:tetratricopeptide repeat protein [Deefgea tanakiae]QZA77113.1 tetratricopeptide repeat protein [Deefgea tanakiae]
MSVKANQTELAAALSRALKSAECGSPPLPELASEWVKQARSDAHLHGMALDILGHAHQHLSAHRAAQDAFAAAIEQYQQAGSQQSATNTLILLGTSLLLSEEPLRALEQWSNALELARETQNLAQCARVYLAIGQVYIGFGEDKVALEYNQKALKMAKLLADDRLACETHLYVVNDYLRMKRYAQALAELDCAEQLLTHPNKIWAAEIIYYRGAIHAQQGLFSQAKIELETAYDLSFDNDNLWGQVQALATLGEVLLALHAENTVVILQQALSLAERIQLRSVVERCNRALIQCYLDNQQLEPALSLLAKTCQAHSPKVIHISTQHQQRILELENRSSILQLQRELVV